MNRRRGKTTKMIQAAATASAETGEEVYILCRDNREVGRIMRQLIEEEVWKHDQHPKVNFLSATGCFEAQVNGRFIHWGNIFVDNAVYDRDWYPDEHTFMLKLNNVLAFNTTRIKR